MYACTSAPQLGDGQNLNMAVLLPDVPVGALPSVSVGGPVQGCAWKTVQHGGGVLRLDSAVLPSPVPEPQQCLRRPHAARLVGLHEVPARRNADHVDRHGVAAGQLSTCSFNGKGTSGHSRAGPVFVSAAAAGQAEPVSDREEDPLGFSLQPRPSDPPGNLTPLLSDSVSTCAGVLPSITPVGPLACTSVCDGVSLEGSTWEEELLNRLRSGGTPGLQDLLPIAYGNGAAYCGPGTAPIPSEMNLCCVCGPGGCSSPSPLGIAPDSVSAGFTTSCAPREGDVPAHLAASCVDPVTWPWLGVTGIGLLDLVSSYVLYGQDCAEDQVTPGTATLLPSQWPGSSDALLYSLLQQHLRAGEETQQELRQLQHQTLQSQLFMRSECPVGSRQDLQESYTPSGAAGGKREDTGRIGPGEKTTRNRESPSSAVSSDGSY